MRKNIKSQVRLIRIKNLINYFHRENRVSNETRDACFSFLNTLFSKERELYFKMCPGDEGDFIFIFGKKQNHMVIVDDQFLHFIQNVGTNKSKHFENLKFNRKNIPKKILSVIFFDK